MNRPSRPKRPPRRPHYFRPRLEALEDRWVPSGFGLLEVPGLPGGTVAATFTFAERNAGLRSELGLYKVDADSGAVGVLAPGAIGYAEAALRSPTREVIFRLADGPGATSTFRLDAGAKYAFYLIPSATTKQLLECNPSNSPDGAPLAFFSLAAASPDGFGHAELLAAGVIGFEDLPGGGDKDFADL